ncbi:MAG: peptidylprolyl isomerase [Planctomycetota bacterium]|jgi:peptidyl-prolyl cis-trans isomerase B (cyclophilin B)
MKSFVLAVTLLSAAVACQTGGANAQDATAKRDREVTLSSNVDVVAYGGVVELILTVQANKDITVDATVLAGYDLETKIDGKDGPRIRNRVSGKVKLAAGTKIERTIKVSSKQIFPGGEPTGTPRVTFVWPSFIGTGTTLTVAPDMSKINLDDLDLSKTTVTLITNFGNMTVKFRPDKAPNTVRNFVKLVKDGFYDGTRFHRVIQGFMIQGGCPNTKEGATGMPGTGSPGYKIKAEFNDIRHTRGVLSMARSADPDSAGSQFFVMHATKRHLDGKYTGFGELVSGFETLDKIAAVPCGGSQGSTPTTPVHLKMATLQPVFKNKK